MRYTGIESTAVTFLYRTSIALLRRVIVLTSFSLFHKVGIDEHLRLGELYEGQVSLDHLINIHDDLLIVDHVIVEVFIH